MTGDRAAAEAFAAVMERWDRERLSTSSEQREGTA